MNTSREFTQDDAHARAVSAVETGIAREEDTITFAGWLMDTYRGEEAEYVDGLSSSTLYGRFLEAIHA